MKSCSMSLTTRKMQIKVTVKYHLRLSRMSRIRKTDKGVARLEPSYTADGMKMVQPLWETVWWFFKRLIITSVMSDSATIWTAACQAPLCVGFSKQEYWNG